MSPELRKIVRARANGRCEYCHFHEDHLPLLPFHVDHVVARQHGGSEELDNLVWACPRCNSYKGTNLAGIDPDSSQVVRIFNPRISNWNDHFSIVKGSIVGSTPAGRTTVWLLQMNFEPRVLLRSELVSSGKW